MITEANNSEKFGNELELKIDSPHDVVSIIINGYNVVVRMAPEAINVFVYDETPLERYEKVGEQRYAFKDLAGKAEED